MLLTCNTHLILNLNYCVIYAMIFDDLNVDGFVISHGERNFDRDPSKRNNEFLKMSVYDTVCHLSYW